MANPFRTVIKVGATAVAGILLFFGIKYLYTAWQTSAAVEKINIKISKARIHKVSLDGIEMRANVQVQNPTNTKVTFIQPFVRLLAKGSTIASSDVSDKSFELNPMSQVDLQEISIKLQLLTLLSFLIQVNFQFPATADSLIKKVIYIGSQIKTIAKSSNLQLSYSTVANGFTYESTEKVIADDKTITA